MEIILPQAWASGGWNRRPRRSVFGLYAFPCELRATSWAHFKLQHKVAPKEHRRDKGHPFSAVPPSRVIEPRKRPVLAAPPPGTARTTGLLGISRRARSPLTGGRPAPGRSEQTSASEVAAGRSGADRSNVAGAQRRRERRGSIRPLFRQRKGRKDRANR